MKRTLALLAVLLLPWTCKATAFTGSFRYSNGTGVNGRLMIRLQRAAQNSCTTPSIQVPITPVYVTVANGAMQSSPDIVPSDCLTPFQTYYFELRSGTALLLSGQYYVVVDRGAIISPTLGSSEFHVAGFTTDGISDDPSVYSLNTIGGIGGLKVTTAATGTLPNGAPTNFTLRWPSSFPSATYTATCTVRNITSPAIIYVSVISAKTATTITPTVFVNGSGKSGTIICRGRT